MKSKSDLHLVEYYNPDNGRRHRIWLFRKQTPMPDTSTVHHDLRTLNDGNAIVVYFEDAADETHCHRYPMMHVARSEAVPTTEDD